MKLSAFFSNLEGGYESFHWYVRFVDEYVEVLILHVN